MLKLERIDVTVTTPAKVPMQQLTHRTALSLTPQTDNGGNGMIPPPSLDLDTANQHLANAEATEIVEWGVQTFGSGLVMSTSFGIQSAVMLHLVTQVVPNIPVIWVDTGYLPHQTYLFAEELTQRLQLNLKVYQSVISPARMEALHGKLWESGHLEDLDRYTQLRKVEPMQRAFRELQATAWLAGLRREQTDFRRNLKLIDFQSDRYKLLPILEWNAKDIYTYLTKHDLPYHPLFDQGYTTIGDWHSSRPMTAADRSDRDTRFHGLKQECGLHLPETTGESQSLDSSAL